MIKAWGSGDEKVAAKNFELLFNVGRSEDQARDPDPPRRWQSKSSLGQGVGGALFKKFHPPPLVESVHEVGKLHPMTPGSVIVANVPEVLPPCDKDISGCHLSRFLCLSEEYQV